MNVIERLIGIFKVNGKSMLPILAEGDFVITSRLLSKIRSNDLVVVEHPVYGRLVKRVLEVSNDNRLWLCGNNTSSLTPEKIGWINAEDIKGKVYFSIKK
ncbi:hypothetical protein MNBD_GAMMA16-2043 [hydrothermal vent metagenome]|uniref:Peptidase S24/S26A/S26B/S26C domain-containing protein n=1 Tax=hydrothermal vent metagenome TaxID=652676 RepID=A0A3B0ZUV2_9ZZZZ